MSEGSYVNPHEMTAVSKARLGHFAEDLYEQTFPGPFGDLTEAQQHVWIDTVMESMGRVNIVVQEDRP